MKLSNRQHDGLGSSRAQVLVSYLPGPLNAVKDSLADKPGAGEEPQRRSRSYLARSRDGCILRTA